MIRLSRFYSNGVIVDRDLKKAAEWLKQSIELGIDWAKPEYLDVLNRINTPETHS